MVVKVYISGISGNKEVKKRQQRVLMILDSRNFKYELVDITEPGNEGDKDFMQNHSTSLGATIGDSAPRHPLPPQIFNDTSYCGDYDQFDLSNENDELEKFLKLAPDDSVTSSGEAVQAAVSTNGATPATPTPEMADDTNEAEALENSNEAEAAVVQVANGSSDNGAAQEEPDEGHVADEAEEEDEDA